MFELHHGDCLEVMRDIPSGSVDCVITDPPYGTTACKWDSVIPFEPMWEQLKRIAKPKAAICLFGSQPFTSALVMSNPKMFKWEDIWDKKLPVGHLNANRQPLRRHENILVFGAAAVAFNPQKALRDKPRVRTTAPRRIGLSDSAYRVRVVQGGTHDHRNPTSIVEVSNAHQSAKVHPTQKPVDLLRYLVRTYTNEGETVLDFTMGSGSTGVACLLENRKFIGIEKDAGYFEIAKNRIEQTMQREPLFV